MTGNRPMLIWKLLWSVISPLVILGLLIGMIVSSASGTLKYEIWDHVQVREYTIDHFSDSIYSIIPCHQVLPRTSYFCFVLIKEKYLKIQEFLAAVCLAVL